MADLSDWVPTEGVTDIEPSDSGGVDDRTVAVDLDFFTHLMAMHRSCTACRYNAMFGNRVG
jgi:hypothetical protein